MAIFPEGDIYMCQCMEKNQVRMGNILTDSSEKILKTQDCLLKEDEIKQLFCVDYKEICKECNLACIYCYEGAGCRTTRMNKATADRFIGFMINQAKARNSKSMYINLFGGEPLLNIECGFYILDALKKFCAEKNIEFASGIITNGTLLTAEIVSQLINYNCQQIQIRGIRMAYYGYHRISTKEQHLDRGIIEIKRFCENQKIKLESIFTDKITGKNFDRPRYTVLVEDVLRVGDTLIITELDRLGRNKQEILKQLRFLEEKGVRVMVLELPTTLFDLSQMENNLAKMMIETINNMMIELYGGTFMQKTTARKLLL